MGYIQEIRKIIGHRPLILIGSTMLIIDDGKRLLMQKRSDIGMWGVPGGNMELGERLEDTARRETMEETGYEVVEMEFLKMYSGPELYFEYPNGDQVYIVTAVYRAKEYKQSKQDYDEEVLEIRFFPLDNLPENISPPIQLIINDLKPCLLNGTV